MSCSPRSTACSPLSAANPSPQEVDLAGDKKAIIVFVPVPQLPLFQKLIRDGLVSELEKKFSGKHVAVIAQVRFLAGGGRGLFLCRDE